MIKKAFILGAGLGTRLRPLTNVRPKPLVPLFHKPMLMYAMDRALSLGIHDIAVNTHHLAEVWEEFFPTAGASNLSGLNNIEARPSIYKEASVTFFNEPELLETGGGIKNIEPWIGDDDVLVYNGDIYCSIPLEPLVKLHTNSDYDATLVLRSDGPAQHIAIDGTTVKDIHNKLGKAEGTHQFTGIYAIKSNILKKLEPNKKESIIEAFLELSAEEKLGAVVIDEGEWLDLGTREMYLEAHTREQMIPQDAQEIAPSAKISDTARIINSWVAGEVTIEAGASVKNSIIWDGVTIAKDAEIDGCIIYSDVKEGDKIQDLTQ